jgi:hypothetical protein
MRLVSYYSACYAVLCTAFNHMSCVISCDTILRVTRCYSSACYVVLGSVIACASSDVGLLRVTIRCVFLEPTRRLYYTGYAYTSIYRIVSFAPSHVSSYQRYYLPRVVLCTVFYNVFCVPMHGFMNVTLCLTSSHVIMSILPDVH